MSEIKDARAEHKGAGGTQGGIGTFFIGMILAVVGGYLLLQQVQVTGGSWTFMGQNAFGLSLLPFLFGLGFLFFNGKSIVGWLLLSCGIAIIFAAILMNMRIYFQSTSLFNTLIMLGMLAAGIGLVARSLRNVNSASE